MVEAKKPSIPSMATTTMPPRQPQDALDTVRKVERPPSVSTDSDNSLIFIVIFAVVAAVMIALFYLVLA